MANLIYNSFKKAIGDGSIDWDDNSTTTIKCMLVTSAYVVDIDTHVVIQDVLNEVVGTNYTAGGNLISNRSVTIDNSTNIAKYDGDDVAWVSSTLTAAFGVVYKDTGDVATSPLISFVDFGGNKSSSNGDFVIEWHADGVFKLA